MYPFRNLVSSVFSGNRISSLKEFDNGFREGGCMDAWDPVDPEDVVPAKAVPPPRQIKAGLLRNPYLGPLEAVRYTDVPARVPGGGMLRLYAICTGAASFTTFDRPTAVRAWRALQAGDVVRIDWRIYKEGRKPSYDIVRLSVLPEHGNIQPLVQDQ